MWIAIALSGSCLMDTTCHESEELAIEHHAKGYELAQGQKDELEASGVLKIGPTTLYVTYVA